ncbi:MAG: tetratricopeptide repeat protein [Desulfovibrionaceae bacterium]
MSRTFGWVEIHAVDHCNNNCDSCHNFSPLAPKRDYDAAEYFHGLDILAANNVCFPTISIMGGEPFLHPDLPRFASRLKERYPNKRLLCTTNCFWLGEQDIAHFDDFWRRLNTLTVSVYPNMVHKIGGMERFRALLAQIQKRHPHLELFLPDKHVFRSLSFFNEPRPVNYHCPNAECTCLLTDGRMARCGAGAFQHFSQEITPAFAASAQMFYDLNRFDWQQFWLWRKRYPLDACPYCGLVLGQPVQWKVQKGVPYRKDYEAEYHVRVAEHVFTQGDPATALARLRHALELAPDSAEALNDLGAIYAHLGRRDKARACLEKALELQPDFPSARDNLAVLLRS